MRSAVVESAGGPRVHGKGRRPMSLASVSDRSLETWLWDANILRGPVDASEFKAYVFRLLFLKRIGDVCGEERLAALEEWGGDEEHASLPEQHRFQIPEGSHGSDLRTRATNVGAAITAASSDVPRVRRVESNGSSHSKRWPGISLRKTLTGILPTVSRSRP